MRRVLRGAVFSICCTTCRRLDAALEFGEVMTINFKLDLNRGAVLGAVGAGMFAAAAHGASSPLWVRMTGDASPSVTSLSHVYVMAWFQESGEGMKHEAYGAWSVGSASREWSNPLDLTTSIAQDISVGVFDDPIGAAKFSVIGVYEDGGVSISLLDSAFIPGFSSWDNLFATSESTVQGWLESGNTDALTGWFYSEMIQSGYAPNMGVRASQVDFSIADVNGSSFVEWAMVPSPGAAGLLAIGGVLVARRRR